MIPSVNNSNTGWLVVEGKDEVNFFTMLLESMAIKGVECKDISGKDNLDKQFSTLIKSPDYTKIASLAIFLDADNDAKAAFDKACGVLSKNRLPVPTAPADILKTSHKKIGVFILPNNQATGMLENLVMEAVLYPSAKTCAENFWLCVKERAERQEIPMPRTPVKSKTMAYLAAMEQDVHSVGIATKKGYWNLDHPTLTPLKNFLQDLFAP